VTPIIAIRVVSSSPMQVSSILRVGACVGAACLVGISCQSRPTPPEEPKAAVTPAVTARVLTVGEVAPDFSLPGTDGREYTLGSYRGRQAVVLAWFAKAFTEG